MKNLLVWQKLALLGAVFLLPLVIVIYVLVSSVHSLGIATARHELLGVEYGRPLLRLLRDLQRLRGLTAAVEPVRRRWKRISAALARKCSETSPRSMPSIPVCAGR